MYSIRISRRAIVEVIISIFESIFDNSIAFDLFNRMFTYMQMQKIRQLGFFFRESGISKYLMGEP